ncbi:hypothetical protein [uncultured Cellulomonas sp.]|uniref:hypothetical protein n=1 Tax=uncultured Cellulomonas sp. TaxID=189682 RepID=UPI0028EF6287|nr:hypothetical protein [uncultured Cellulomonas sp.]
MVHEPVPAGSWEAADWIARRHVWVRGLVARIVPGGTTSENWLEELTAAVVGVETHRHAGSRSCVRKLPSWLYAYGHVDGACLRASRRKLDR